MVAAAAALAALANGRDELVLAADDDDEEQQDDRRLRSGGTSRGVAAPASAAAADEDGFYDDEEDEDDEEEGRPQFPACPEGLELRPFGVFGVGRDWDLPSGEFVERCRKGVLLYVALVPLSAALEVLLSLAGVYDEVGRWLVDSTGFVFVGSVRRSVMT